MDIVDDIICIINNKYDSKNNYIMPISIIIFEYNYTKCYDCDLAFEEIYKCGGCDVFRCKFHHFVNSVKNMCIKCQNDNMIIPNEYHDLYKCIKCNIGALYGYINNIILCTKCTLIYKIEYPNIINFGSYCTVFLSGIPCCGTGWFKNNNNKCSKHKNDDSNYNYCL